MLRSYHLATGLFLLCITCAAARAQCEFLVRNLQCHVPIFGRGLDRESFDALRPERRELIHLTVTRPVDFGPFWT